MKKILRKSNYRKEENVKKETREEKKISGKFEKGRKYQERQITEKNKILRKTSYRKEENVEKNKLEKSRNYLERQIREKKKISRKTREKKIVRKTNWRK